MLRPVDRSRPAYRDVLVVKDVDGELTAGLELENSLGQKQT